MRPLNDAIKKKVPVRVGRLFWKSDWHLSLLLGLLLVLIFIIYPLASARLLLSFALKTIFMLILMSGVAVVAGSRVWRMLASLFAVGTAVVEWMKVYNQSEGLADLALVLWIVFLVMLTSVILMRVFAGGRINFHHIQGAVAAYLLIGWTWSLGYRLLFSVDPRAFSMVRPTDESAMISKLVYFSFVTLTTVGYGDVTPVHSAARSLCMLEALCGQLFPAVLIARLVSMEVSQREKDIAATARLRRQVESNSEPEAKQVQCSPANETTTGESFS